MHSSTDADGDLSPEFIFLVLMKFIWISLQRHFSTCYQRFNGRTLYKNPVYVYDRRTKQLDQKELFDCALYSITKDQQQTQERWSQEWEEGLRWDDTHFPIQSTRVLRDDTKKKIGQEVVITAVSI
ncbi:hypothetical protein OUZ56_001759 [Daphnia magna]|uniref:Uncharacterized protein n=1 Tax=Daphnia magna TaxID=35525 RepID=A0ABR0A3N1_9CRUS|nr:hypothetical protein OUZ56_001759 [Daphnia magna]